MDDFFQSIETWFDEKITNALVNLLEGNLAGVFNGLDARVDEITGIVSQTPQSWNGTIFGFITNLSETVIVPIASLVITYVLIYELITMVMDKNNFHEFDSSLFFRYLGKACIAVVLVSHTQEIVEALFEVGSEISTSVGTYITGSTQLNVETTLFPMIESQALAMSVGQLFLNVLETLIIRFVILIMGIYIRIIMYSRFIEIYLYMSVAPIPFSTMTNREWGNIGTNYLRGLLALAFQAFLIMALVGIYSTLITSMTNLASLGDFSTALHEILLYTALLAMMLGKTSSIAKSIFNTH